MTMTMTAEPYRSRTWLINTVAGRTAAATIPFNAPYDFFLREILLRSFSRDNAEMKEALRTAPTFLAKASKMAYLVHEGKVVDRSTYQSLLHPSSSSSPLHISLRLRLKGGMTDRQNRVGSKFGGGGVSSSQNAERERKERLRQLALESIDLAKDPYLMRNHLGTYECKLCLTLHTNEGNYLAHTQGKKHQAGLARRAAMEKQLAPAVLPAPSTTQPSSKQPRVRIGRPGYEVTKSRDPDTDQRCLSFELHYPQLDDQNVQPRHRFMSAYEQRVESPPDRRYQYLLIACDPYETVAFKIPNEPIDREEGKFVTNWDIKGKRFTLTLHFMEPEPAAKE